jgi:hypothetical protein
MKGGGFGGVLLRFPERIPNCITFAAQASQGVPDKNGFASGSDSPLPEIAVTRHTWRHVKASGPDKIFRRQLESLGRMGKQPALRDRPDTAMAVTENLQDAVITGPGFQPEVRFQGHGRDHAFDRTRPSHEGKSHTPAVREYLRFEFVQGFHDYRG